jgi:hypothetical protein
LRLHSTFGNSIPHTYIFVNVADIRGVKWIRRRELKKKRKKFVKNYGNSFLLFFKGFTQLGLKKIFVARVMGDFRGGGDISKYLNMSVVIPSSENSTAGGEYRSLTPHNSAPLKSLSSKPPNRM